MGARLPGQERKGLMSPFLALRGASFFSVRVWDTPSNSHAQGHSWQGMGAHMGAGNRTWVSLVQGNNKANAHPWSSGCGISGMGDSVLSGALQPVEKMVCPRPLLWRRPDQEGSSPPKEGSPQHEDPGHRNPPPARSSSPSRELLPFGELLP